MEFIADWILGAWEERERRLDDLYIQLGKETVPVFADLVQRRKKLIDRSNWLEAKLDAAEERLDEQEKGGASRLRRLPLAAGLATAESIAVFCVEKAQNHLAATYGRRIRRIVKRLEKGLS